jgi:hypothetical protein
MSAETVIPYAEIGESAEVIGFPLSPEVAVEREQITRIYESAQRLNMAGYPDQVVNDAIAGLDAVHGVRVMSDIDFRGDDGLRCAEWTFGYMHGESWALRGFAVDASPQLWANPQGFLEHHGYSFTVSPFPGCIIAYGDTFPDGRIWLEHFGIYLGVSDHDGQEYVMSKFGQGPIVEHQKDTVSAVWGGKYFYLHKEDLSDDAMLISL